MPDQGGYTPPRLTSFRERLKARVAQQHQQRENTFLSGRLHQPDAADFVDRFCNIIARGNHVSTACAVLGINPRTYHNWMTWGEEGNKDTNEPPKEPYISFAEAVRQAEALAEQGIVEAWTSQFGDDWRAAATFLARRHPERWGKQREEATTDAGGGSITVIFSRRDAVTDEANDTGEPEADTTVFQSPVDALPFYRDEEEMVDDALSSRRDDA